jgi:hypothetical protein
LMVEQPIPHRTANEGDAIRTRRCLKQGPEAGGDSRQIQVVGAEYRASSEVNPPPEPAAGEGMALRLSPQKADAYAQRTLPPP